MLLNREDRKVKPMWRRILGTDPWCKRKWLFQGFLGDYGITSRRGWFVFQANFQWAIFCWRYRGWSLIDALKSPYLHR